MRSPRRRGVRFSFVVGVFPPHVPRVRYATKAAILRCADAACKREREISKGPDERAAGRPSPVTNGHE
ncbi:hypothetical protein HMPREF9440_02292 [Sutterella parvirubra YIT 11816]|uniref:Uncharacterized protein n=1 Tax=Sutterella parvirubra YIT 11816 TaxID=762967 RepID=H3KHP6_9BURK|nr:hypothetical protein HMPREF9440_02292 [Sutterella parvirubra YIT 11816]